MDSLEFREIRRQLRMSQNQLARALQMGPNGNRQVRRWEDGQAPISGPVAVAIKALAAGWIPK